MVRRALQDVASTSATGRKTTTTTPTPTTTTTTGPATTRARTAIGAKPRLPPPLGPLRLPLSPRPGYEGAKYKVFRRLVEARFAMLLRRAGRLGEARPEDGDDRGRTAGEERRREWQAFGIQSQSEMERQARLFGATLARCFDRAAAASGPGSARAVSRADNPLFWSLRHGFVRGDAAGLDKELAFAFRSFLLRSRFSRAVTASHQRLADLRHPYEWFPATRAMQRTVHLHVGPTNSGKTYRALQALDAARSGIYAGPLRLLAHEVFSRFRARGRPCALVTGEEQRFPPGHDGPADPPPPFQSCTVEMTPLNRRVDVAVIDEVQMMADDDRGWAWTQALLGVQAAHVHACGEDRAVPLVRALCARTGDRCVVHRYQRLSPLRPAPASLRGDLANLRKGDAVVAFSRVALHTLKAGIEQLTRRRCAIVYGSLPPETRAQQAALFNDPTNDYDFLAASDAIGMGLNLDIRRVVFETVAKHDGAAFRTLSVPELRQIAGRAGRFRTAAQDMAESSSSGTSTTTAATATTSTPPLLPPPGFVTTMEDEDLDVVRRAFDADPEPLRTAGIQPPTFVIEKFAAYFPPATPLSFVLLRLRAMAKVSARFHLCRLDDAIEIADIIQPLPLSIHDRCIFLSAPVSLRDPGQRDALAAFARCVALMRGRGRLLDFPELDLDILDATRRDFHLGPAAYLRRLEALHKSIALYLWLSYRYTGVFRSQALAFHVKRLVEQKITDHLDGLTFVPEHRQQRAAKVRRLAEQLHQRERDSAAQVHHD